MLHSKVFLHPCPSFYCNNQFLGFYHFSCWDIFYVWLLFQASSCEIVLSRASFPERPSNFLGKKTNFKIKTCLIVVHFLAPKLVNFALLTDSFFLSFFKINFDLEANTENIKVTGTFEKQAPGNRTKIRYVNYFPANVVIQQNKS